MSFEQIAWLPLCVVLTAAGVVLAYFAFRRRGVSAGLRATAWALLPLAAYLTGALRTLWNIGTALVSFATGLVFSIQVWAGVALAGLSLLLFFVSGGLRGRALSRLRTAGRSSASADKPSGTSSAPSSAPSSARPARQDAAHSETKPLTKPQSKPASDDFSDIEDILKRRGIS